MTGSMKNEIMRKCLTAGIYVAFAMASVVLFTLGPKIESLIHPVVGAFKIERIWSETYDGERHFYMRGAMLKLRGECEPTEIVMVTDGGISDENAKVVTLDFNPDPVHIQQDLVTRPAGAQHWGPWRVLPPEEPIGPIVTIIVTHRCHALWKQSQVIYTGLTKEIFPGLILDTASGS